MSLDFTDSAQRFDNHFRSEGGIFIPELHQTHGVNFEYYHDLLMGAIRSDIQLKSKRPLLLAFYFINNSAINAIASKDDKYYYIGINSGVVYLLERLFCHIMCNPNMFSWIGDSASETAAEPMSRKLFQDIREFTDNGLSLSYDRPKDPLREAMARFLTTQALTFLAFHELTHIMNGHIDYLNDTLGIMSIYENRFSAGERAENLLSQTLEWDADAIGTCDLINFAFDCNKHSSLTHPDYAPMVSYPETVVGLSVFASYAIFRIFSGDASPTENLIESSYPSFDLRSKLLMGVSKELIELKRKLGRYDEVTEEKLLKSHIWNCAAAEEYLHAIETGGPKYPDDLDPTSVEEFNMNEVNSAHAAVLRESWQALRPKLIPYAFAKLV